MCKRCCRARFSCVACRWLLLCWGLVLLGCCGSVFCLFPLFLFSRRLDGRGRHVPAPAREGRRVTSEGHRPKNRILRQESPGRKAFDFSYLLSDLLYWHVFPSRPARTHAAQPPVGELVVATLTETNKASSVHAMYAEIHAVLSMFASRRATAIVMDSYNVASLTVPGVANSLLYLKTYGEQNKFMLESFTVHAILVTIQAHRKHVTQLNFKMFNVPATHVAIQAVLSPFMSWRTTVTHCLLEYLRKYLIVRGYHFHPAQVLLQRTGAA